MNKEELLEFKRLGKKMLDLYKKLPQNESKRKIIAACDDETNTNQIMFFQGTMGDAYALQDFLNNHLIVEEKTNSYLELCLREEGKGVDLYLRVPTFWDDIEKMWMAFIKTPDSNRLIHAHGKDSFELQNAFNIELNLLFHSELCAEVHGMFKPLEYWEKE